MIKENLDVIFLDMEQMKNRNTKLREVNKKNEKAFEIEGKIAIVMQKIGVNII